MRGLTPGDKAGLLKALQLGGAELHIRDEAAAEALVETGRIQVTHCPDHQHIDVTQLGMLALRLDQHFPGSMS